MANLECRKCGDLVDVEARTVVLPFECKWCVEGWVPMPGLSFPKLIVQTKGSSGWFRSLNDHICGTFTSFAEAEKAIAAETDGYERRVVAEGTPDYVLTGGYNKDLVKPAGQEYVDIEYVLGTAGIPIPTVSEVASEQFDLDTKLIEDLELQLKTEQEYNRVALQKIETLNDALDTQRGVSLSRLDSWNNALEEADSLRTQLNDALALASGQELIISEKASDIRIYRSLLGLSRG
jgi:hypothetical protein